MRKKWDNYKGMKRASLTKIRSPGTNYRTHIKQNQTKIVIIKRPSDTHSKGGNKSSKLPNFATQPLNWRYYYSIIRLKPNAPNDNK